LLELLDRELLDEDIIEELEATDELLGIELDEDTTAELRLGTELELETEKELLGTELDEDFLEELEVPDALLELLLEVLPSSLSSEQEKTKAKASPMLTA